MGNCCNHCERKISSVSVLVNSAETQVEITIPETVLKAETKYCLILAQPCPVAGFNLPVVIINGTSTTPVPMQKFGFANIEFGEDLPKCRNRIPLYYNNAGEFIDLRCHEHHCFCKGGR